MFEEFFAPHIVPQLQLGKLIQFSLQRKNQPSLRIV